MSDNKQDKKELYNSIPVFYCKRCLSLKIMKIDDECYCDKCGSIEVDEAPFKAWETMYELRYDKKFFDVERIKRLRKLW